MCKVGDIVLCKKDYLRERSNFLGNVIFTKGNNYKIVDVRRDLMYVEFLDKFGKINSEVFTTIEIEDEDYIFGNYFYTLEEIRKLKLEKLNEI